MKKVYFVAISAIIGVGVVLCFLSDIQADILLDQFIYPEYSKKISMDFEKANLNDILKIFSQQSGLNFVAEEDIIDKKVTLFLDEVPVEEALDRILQAHNLTYEIKQGSNIFTVKSMGTKPKDLLTRVYKLKHATVLSSKLNATFTIEEDLAGGGGGGSGSGGGGDTGIVAAIKIVLSSQGNIVEDPRTNSLIVTDRPAQFSVIERTIARLDVPIPQILIEVEMLDISKSTADLFGIKAGATPLTFTGAQREHYYPWNTNELVLEGQTAPTYSLGTISAAGLTATLQMLKTISDTKSLARPRILTLNNETAQINITTDEAIGIKSIQTSSEGASVTSVEAERVQTGVFLTVTPQVNLQTREITMAIAPSVIEAKTGGTFSGQTFKDPEMRGSKSILRVKDNETIVIGGLLRKDTENTNTKVPFLSKIPLLGLAFKHKDKTDTNRELVIFITPRIVPAGGLSKLAHRNTGPIIREQDIPPRRQRAIEKTLAHFEKRIK